MKELVLLGRPDCHLCDRLLADIEPLCRAAGATLRVHDVDSRPDWRAAYGLRIPVVLGDGQMIGAWPVDLEAIARWLRVPG
ncbi:MAG: glutaredoxin family protein [Gammaproteobacteria bacterium]|nr:glutaredoxin family protein [Gammaproteobacteria bacterium]